MPLAIRTTALSKRFPGGYGVHDLHLNVPAGAIYAFLGPNGAGKTTTVRLLLDLLQPDAGSVSLFGEPLTRRRRSALAQVGALVESPSLYAHLSGRQNLEITRTLLDAPRARIDAVLDEVDLRDAADRRVRDYSLGMRQRLALALALLGEPRLLILDEPSNGLDPAGILAMRLLLRRLATDRGLTVFVSSHLLSEIEQIASHVGVLQAGRLRFEGELAQLRERIPPLLHLRCDDAARAATLLEQVGERVVRDDDGLLRITLARRPADELNRMLVTQGIAVSHLSLEPASLERLFFDLTDAAPLEAAA
jgi:ABC-type multidrug transport system ATPase subunit